MLSPQIIHSIGRYEIKSLIGAGGMGTLYLARDTNPNTYRLVALKLLNANLDSEDLRERFGREARSLAALNHPNVVNIYDSGEYNWAPYIVMEYVRGETLAEKIARKAPLSIGQKLKLMTELCAGLAHAHEAGIIHRDIKPANLMVDHHGRLKLLDFGIARGEVGMTRFGPQVTQVNVRIGTPGYMSPEQIEGGEIDGRSDLFAVGAVLYELIAYREAFSGTTTRQIENKVLQSQPAPLTSIVPGLDPELESIVNRALAKSPSERYQDANQLESALEHVRWRLGLAESTPSGKATPLPGVNVGRKSHESRAETAYQRARAFHEENARDAAKRYCIEALAEEPNHEAARALLHEIDPRAWVASEAPRESTPIPPTVQTPGRGRSPASDERTMHSTRGRGSASYGDEPTMLSTGARSGPSYSNEPTMLGTRAGRGTPGTDAATVLVTQEGSRWRFPPGWQRYVPIVGAVALVVVSATVAVFVARWLFAPNAGEVALTVTKPKGGTISADGINCGTAASDCSTTLKKGATVEFRIEADKGFRFSGFTGDCAPAGRTIMNSPRTCGATFEEDVPVTGGNSALELLTIAPATGGTVVAEGIKCGSQGKECSTNRPRGSHLKLVAWADKGFTFQGFTGDCTQSGEAHMIAPRTCGAMFVQAGAANNLGSGGRSGPGSRGSAGGTGVAPGGTGPGGTSSGGGSVTGGGGSTARGGSGGGIAPGGGTTGGTGGDPGGGIAPPPPKSVDDKDAELIAPPKPPPPPAMADLARKEIEGLLERYRSAYEARNFEGVQRAFPSVPPAIRDQFKQIKSLKYDFAGAPKYVQLDAFNGTAVVEIGSTQTTEMPTGKRPPITFVETIDLQKRGADGQWVINSVRRAQK
jgi:serine/threonine protein kinase